MSPTDSTTRLDLFTVRRDAVAGAVWRMAADRRVLGRERGLTFWKLLGTGDGRTFDARDADLRRWAVLTVWRHVDEARWFSRPGGPLAPWRQLAVEHWWVTLALQHCRGHWSGRAPFGAPPADGGSRHADRSGTGGRSTDDRPVADGRDADGPVAALTRARLRARTAPRFWRAVPPVNADLTPRTGLLLRLGVGEAPLGLQGTFSLWRSVRALRDFAYRGGAHRDVIDRSRDERWYAEELFARFAVVDHDGTVFGGDPLAR